ARCRDEARVALERRPIASLRLNRERPDEIVVHAHPVTHRGVIRVYGATGDVISTDAAEDVEREAEERSLEIGSGAERLEYEIEIGNPRTDPRSTQRLRAPRHRMCRAADAQSERPEEFGKTQARQERVARMFSPRG